jgi:hypothetical protein
MTRPILLLIMLLFATQTNFAICISKPHLKTSIVDGAKKSKGNNIPVTEWGLVAILGGLILLTLAPTGVLSTTIIVIDVVCILLGFANIVSKKRKGAGVVLVALILLFLSFKLNAK